MKKKVYQKHYAFIVENPEDEFWKSVCLRTGWYKSSRFVFFCVDLTE